MITKKMLKKKEAKLIVALLVAFCAVLYYFFTYIYSVHGNKIIRINVKGQAIYAEVVSTEEKRALGLGGRSNLCSSCGMFFEFQAAGKYAFWMKGMRFPLDIVWLRNGEVVYVEKNIKPSFAGMLNPNKDADVVLEFNAGSVAKLGIEVGDKL